MPVLEVVALLVLFPALLDSWGRTPLLIALVGTSLLGALVTWRYRIETAGVSLDDLLRAAAVEREQALEDGIGAGHGAASLFEAPVARKGER